MRRELIVGLVVLSCLTSCGSSPDRIAEPGADVAPVVTVAADLPDGSERAERAERYGDEVAAGRPPVEMELSRRLRSVESRTVECLVDAGFERLPVGPALRGDGPEMWFGPDDPFAVASQQAGESEAVEAVVWPDDAELTRAITGGSTTEYPLVGPDGRVFGGIVVETGGCRGASILAEFGSVDRYVELSQSVHLESEVIAAAFAAVSVDPAYVDLQQRLERCMKAAGWPKVDRDALWKDATKSAAWSDCRTELRYLDVASAIFSDYVARSALDSDGAAMILDR